MRVTLRVCRSRTITKERGNISTARAALLTRYLPPVYPRPCHDRPSSAAPEGRVERCAGDRGPRARVHVDCRGSRRSQTGVEASRVVRARLSSGGAGCADDCGFAGNGGNLGGVREAAVYRALERSIAEVGGAEVRYVTAREGLARVLESGLRVAAGVEVAAVRRVSGT